MLRDNLLVSRPSLLEEALLSKVALPIPRLSKAGMPSRSEAGAVCSKTKVPINNKERFAGIYKESLRETLNRRYKKGRPQCGWLSREKRQQPFNVPALNPQREQPMKCDKYMGMDVHQATTVVAVMDAEGTIVLETIVETQAASIIRLMQSLSGPLHVTFEETAQAEWLYE